MKRNLSYLLLVSLLTVALTACGNPSPANTGKLQIVATTFPQYDWVRQILGDKFSQMELSLLLDDGVDLHSYQPSVADIAKISTSDMFIYVGGESDAWVKDALATATNKNMVVINMLEVLGDRVKEEEIIAGMEHNHEHDHGEIDPQDIYDRPLSDWQGNWTTIEKALNDGSLDEYIAQQAEKNDVGVAAQRAVYEERWQSAYATLSITDSSISFGGVLADYNYLGYKLVETDHGVSVWYGFEAENEVKDAPRYIAFSDHGTGAPNDHDHDHDHDDDHHQEDDHPHFHLRYGNDSFEALTTISGWSPTYFPVTASDEEIAEAMAGHGHGHGHGHDHAADEHVWLSLKNAQLICAHIAAELGKLDQSNASTYESNAAAYHVKLARLDAAYQEVVDNATVKTLLFGDRFPFRYLVDDYGLSYHAAFPGCSAETEASFNTVVYLANQLDELHLKNVMVIDDSTQALAKTIIANSSAKNQEILVLDSMQSVKLPDIESGVSYLSIMESNLEVLKTALP